MFEYYVIYILLYMWLGMCEIPRTRTSIARHNHIRSLYNAGWGRPSTDEVVLWTNVFIYTTYCGNKNCLFCKCGTTSSISGSVLAYIYSIYSMGYEEGFLLLCVGLVMITVSCGMATGDQRIFRRLLLSANGWLASLCETVSWVWTSVVFCRSILIYTCLPCMCIYEKSIYVTQMMRLIKANKKQDQF